MVLDTAKNLDSRPGLVALMAQETDYAEAYEHNSRADKPLEVCMGYHRQRQ